MYLEVILMLSLIICTVNGVGSRGSRSSRSSRSRSSSRSSSYSSSSSGSSGPTYYEYTINIHIDYNWNDIMDVFDQNYTASNDSSINVNNNSSIDINNYTIKYQSLWTNIKPMINGQSSFRIKKINQTTSNPQDLVYKLELSEDNTTSPDTCTWDLKIFLKIDATPRGDAIDAKDKLYDYVKSNSGLKLDITDKYDQYDGILNIMAVSTSIDGDNILSGGEIAGIVLGSIFGAILLCVGGYCIFSKCTTGSDGSGYENRAWPDIADEYINDPECVKYSDFDVFIDGEYSGHYRQYGKSHKIPKFGLTFNDGDVSGNGTDEVGDYNINGTYSDKTQRMALAQTYIKGTGDYRENQGHTVQIRLEYDEDKKQFKGNWYCDGDSNEWVIEFCGEDMDGGYTTKQKDNKEYQGIDNNEW